VSIGAPKKLAEAEWTPTKRHATGGAKSIDFERENHLVSCSALACDDAGARADEGAVPSFTPSNAPVHDSIDFGDRTKYIQTAEAPTQLLSSIVLRDAGCLFI
jgi:hypothetical protein